MLLPRYPSSTALLLLLSLSPTLIHATPKPRTYNTHHYFALELPEAVSGDALEALALSLNTELVEQVGELAGHWLVKSRKEEVESRSMEGGGIERVLKRWDDLKSSGSGLHSRGVSIPSAHLRSIQHLPIRKRTKREYVVPSLYPRADPSTIDPLPKEDPRELQFAQNNLSLTDPLLPQQWHLVNTQMPDNELNLTGLWSEGVDGTGVKVAMVDDGLDFHHEDLAANFYEEGSYDFNDHTPLPEPRLGDDNHGTRCAGEIAAVPNDVCGVGVSYRAKISGVRILSAPISDADEAAALNYEYQKNQIYSCSWGPPDDGRSMEAPEGLIIKSMVNGVIKGRGGKGSIFVFAAGNGGGVDDQCNFDGYTNSIFSLTIGSYDRRGLHPYYSEQCAAMLAVAPSSGSGDHIHTTDIHGGCTHSHGGTSAAAPLAAGVVALVLQVRPDLTWRDLQHLMVRNSVYFAETDPDWEDTAAGRRFSHKYGYGKIDAGKLVAAARDWEIVKPQAWYDSPTVVIQAPSETMDAGHLRRQGEEVDGGETSEGQPAGDEPAATPEPEPEPPKGIILTAEGIQSTYEVTQKMLDDMNLDKLEHVTIRVWIEHQRRGDVEVELISPNGITSVMARQRRFDEDPTGFNGWKFMSMKHWDEDPVGTWTIIVKDRINSDKVGRFQSWALQLWGSAIDASKAKPWALPIEGGEDEEQIGSKPSETDYGKPTDHLPDDHGSAEGEAHKPGLGAGSSDAATGSDGITAGADEGMFDGIETLKQKSTWIFGAGGLVILASVGLGLFFFLRSRRRKDLFGTLGNGGERGEYGPVSDDMQMGLLARGRQKFLGGSGAGAGQSDGQGGSKVLYDAFAEGDSDPEDDLEDEATALRYHDTFLEDDGEGEGEKSSSGPVPLYRDDEDDEGTGRPTVSAGGASRHGEGEERGNTSWEMTGEPPHVPPPII